MLGPTMCRCQRCEKVVEKRKGSLAAKVLYWGTYVSATPFIPLLFLTGPGVYFICPIYVGLTLSGIAAFQDAAYPHPLCPKCGASLKGLPEVEPEPTESLVPRPLALGESVA